MSNAFLIKGEKLCMVDTGSSNELPAIIKAINEVGAKIQDLSNIIHTHAHYDHSGCAVHLKQSTAAPTVIHRSDLDFLLKGQNITLIPIIWFGKILMPFLNKKYTPFQPDIIIEEAFDLQPYGIAGRIIPTPCHTPGSISILLNSREAIVGDLFGGGKLLCLFQPERPRYHHWYSDFSSAKASITRILKNSPTRFFVGHGGPLDGEVTAEFFSNLF
jgi:hydroxyacylglutathione hydrolase